MERRSPSHHRPADAAAADTPIIDPARCRVLRVISESGSAVQQLVEWSFRSGTAEKVVFKFIPMPMMGSHEDQARILRDARVLFEHDHPNVLRYFGGFFSFRNHLPGITLQLEYASGGSLADIRESEGQLGEPIVLLVAREVLSALRYLHDDRCLLHRDVRPSKTLLFLDGTIKLGDFGKGKRLDSVGLGQTYIGSIRYMSPERIETAHSYPSDIWSVGVMLLECLCGEYPYALAGQQMSEFEVMTSIVEGPPPLRALSLCKASKGMEELLSSMLQKDPEKRFSADQLLSLPILQKEPDDSVKESWRSIIRQSQVKKGRLGM